MDKKWYENLVGKKVEVVNDEGLTLVKVGDVAEIIAPSNDFEEFVLGTEEGKILLQVENGTQFAVVDQVKEAK